MKVRKLLKVNYVKSSKTPPYANLQETPAQFVNNYMIISNEIQTIMSEKQKSEK